METIISEFQVKVDQTGDVHNVVEIQEYDMRRTINGKLVKMHGLTRLEMADGSGPLKRVGPNTFQIVRTGQTARTID